MVGFDVDGFGVLQTFRQFRETCEFPFGVVHPGHEGAAQADLFPFAVKETQVFEDEPPPLPRKSLVLFFIAALDVEEKEVDERQNCPVVLPGSEAATFHGDVKFFLFRPAAEFQQKIELAHGLPARKRHAAPRGVIERLVLQHLLQKRRHRVPFSAQGERFGQAGRSAEAAPGAPLPMKEVPPGAEFVALPGADGGAPAARNALFGRKEDLGPHGPTFRIVAPDAPQGAPFQEHGGPDPRSVVDRELFHIEDERRFIHSVFFQQGESCSPPSTRIS